MDEVRWQAVFKGFSPEMQTFLNNDYSLKQQVRGFLVDEGFSVKAENFVKGQVELELLTKNIPWQPSVGYIANNKYLKYTHSYHGAGKSHFKLEDGSEVVTASQEQTLTKSGDLTDKYREAGDPNFHYYYIKAPGQQWAEMLFNPDNLGDDLKTLFILAGKDLGKNLGRYVFPIEDIKILIDGKDFDGQTVSRWQAAGFLLLAVVVPGSKVLKVAGQATDAIAVAVKLGGGSLVVDTVKYGLRVVTDNNVIRFLNQTGNEIARVVDGVMTVIYNGFGSNIITTANKTTTIIGKWENAIENIWNSGLAKQGENIGGINILGIVTGTLAEQWQKNKQWLDKVIARGDVIRVTANPLDINNVFHITSGIDTKHFKSLTSLKNYLISLPENSIEVGQLGFYGREIRHLFQNGYTFDSLTKQFVK